MKKLTSTEIARLAGVSRSTVSRVVNNYDNVPEQTRLSVMKVIEENEYYPILSGQLLVGKKTGMLGFFWVSETPIANDILASSFFVRVSEAAAALGCLVLTCILKNLSDEANVRQVKKIFMQGRIDAGIFIGVKNREPLIEDLIAKGKIVGVFGHFRPDSYEPNRISVNFECDTVEKVISYLGGLGHRRIAFIGGDPDYYTLQMRHESFLRGMMRHGFEIREKWMYCALQGDVGAYAATKELLENCQGDYPTAICAFNDSAAFHVFTALQEAGISIPGQISVIGIDGHEAGKMSAPTLTTFAFDFQKLFFSLVKRTIQTVERQENVPLTEFFPSVLVERDSCRRIADSANVST